MKKSINQIRLELKAIADAHLQINDYAWKDFLRAYEENDLNYPLMCAYYPSGNIYTNQTQIQLNIVICDRIEKDWNKNLNEVESDTLQICRDVFNVLNESSRWQRIGRVSNCVVNKFINRGGDEVAGHTMQIDFLLRDNSGVCDVPMVGYSFDQAISQGCPSVDIFNSDLSYTTEVASGDSLELPDIDYAVKNSVGTTLAGATVPSVSNIETTLSDVNNIDSDGSTVPTPAGVAFTCTPSGFCDDATAVLKDTAGTTLSTTDIPSGASSDIIAPDATYTVQYEDATPIDSGSIVSGGSVLVEVPNPIVCDDASVTLNSVLMTDIPSGSTENIKVLQSNGMTEVGSKQGVNWRIADSDISLNGDAFLSVKAEDSQDISLVDQDNVDITPISVIGNVIKVDIPVAVANLTTLVTGQTTVSIAGDDGTTQYGREDSFLVLSEDNPHGNTARFTDKLGGSTYAEGVAFDWAYRDEVNQLVIGWQIADNGVDVNFADAVAYCNGLTLDTYSNWFIPNENLLHTLKNTQTTRALNYPPFNDSSNRGFWSGTSLLGVLPTYAECLPNRSYAQLCAIVKTTVANMRVRACRIYTYAEAGV
jgi:hypothetical protein